MEKETKVNNPFDLYDIFGYIIPGLIFLIFSAIILEVFAEELPIKSEFLTRIHANVTFEDLKNLKDALPWWLEFTLLIALIAFIYIAGHIIASISSLLVDKYLIKKMSGYPSEKLFGFTKRSEYNRGFYKFLFVIINLYLLRLMYLEIPDWYREIIPFFSFLLIIIVLKVILSEKRINDKEKAKVYNKWGQLLSSPFNLVVHALERMFGFNEPFNKEFVDEYNKKFQDRFNVDIEKSGTNLYWFSYCYVIEMNDHMRDVIRHFLRMYGFTRNLSTSFFLLFLLTISIKLAGTDHIYRLNIFAFIFLFCAILLMLRYYYLYYNYYSKFIFRAFYQLTIDKKR